MGKNNRKVVVLNQDVGYLFIDIANAAQGRYAEVVLLSGSVVELGSQLDSGVQRHSTVRYRRTSFLARLFTLVGGFIHIVWLLRTRFRNHEVLAASNPPFNTLLPLFVRNRTGLYVLDLYPEALYETGWVSRRNPVVRLWSRLNAAAYRRFAGVWALTPSMRTTMKKIYGWDVGFVPGWASRISSNADYNFLERQGLSDKWVVLYSGNLGREHDLEVLLDCAVKLISEEDIVFVIAGEGWKRKALLDRVEKENLRNVRILAKLPGPEFSALLLHARMGVVTQTMRAARINIPSKTFNILAAGVPVLGIGEPDSDFGRLVNESGAGRVFGPSQVEEICSFVLSCRDDETVWSEFQERARLKAESFTAGNAVRLVEEFACGRSGD